MDTATFVTVIGMWMLLIFGAMTIFLGYRHRRAALEMTHKERMSALEHGLDPPALPADGTRQHGPMEYLHRGVVCIVVGLALMVALALNAGWASAAWALPPVAFGVACLIIHRLARTGPGTDRGSGA